MKGYAVKGGRFTLDKTLAQMMGVMNVAGTGLGSGLHYRIRDNDNIKRTSAFTLMKSTYFRAWIGCLRRYRHHGLLDTFPWKCLNMSTSTVA